MHLPQPRGPLGRALFADLAGRSELSPSTHACAERAAATTAPLTHDDLQLCLAVCYELHYRGFADVDEAWEWQPGLIGLRALLERAPAAALRELVPPVEVTEQPV